MGTLIQRGTHAAPGKDSPGTSGAVRSSRHQKTKRHQNLALHCEPVRSGSDVENRSPVPIRYYPFRKFRHSTLYFTGFICNAAVTINIRMQKLPTVFKRQVGISPGRYACASPRRRRRSLEKLRVNAIFVLQTKLDKSSILITIHGHRFPLRGAHLRLNE
jgi:hypothetical protein